MIGVRALVQAPSVKLTTRRYHVVDFTRGLAALCVLVWHYQHFYVYRAGGEFPPARRIEQPLYWLLEPLYEYGNLAVQFFWLISGFVFCAVYLHRPVPTREFAANRFARLYPLHFFTLLIVAALQAVSIYLTGTTKVYSNYDLWHFSKQLFMVSNWFAEANISFNGPIWSVSIEIMFYILFWATLPWIYRRGILGPLLLAAGFWIAGHIAHVAAPLTMDCGFYFFLGAAAFLIVSTYQQKSLLIYVMAALIFIAGSVIYAISPVRIASLSMPLWLFAVLLLAAISEGAVERGIARWGNWIGDSTYGIYLWHFPLQVLLLIILDQAIGSRAVVQSPWFLLFFVAATVGLARLSFLLIENPARRRLRLLSRPQASRPS